MGPRTVLVHTDHHLAVRLRACLGAAGLHVAAQLTSAVQLADAIVALEPEVLIADITVEGMATMPAVAEAVRRLPGVRVIVLSGWPDRVAARAALAAGAHGFILTGDDARQLVFKVMRVATGGETIVELAAA